MSLGNETPPLLLPNIGIKTTKNGSNGRTNQSKNTT